MAKQYEFDPREVYKYNSSQNTYEVGIALDNYHEVYNGWDFTPGKNRDMDEDLFTYIYESSLEIPLNAGFILNFYLPENRKDIVKEEKSRNSLFNFFNSALLRSYKEKNKLRNNIAQYIVFGVLFLAVAYFVQKNSDDEYIVVKLMNEGFFIGGWVMLWEAFSSLFFKYRDRREEIHHIIRIRNSKITFSYVNEKTVKLLFKE